MRLIGFEVFTIDSLQRQCILNSTLEGHKVRQKNRRCYLTN